MAACLHGSVKASLQDLLSAIDGKIGRVDRQLFGYSLEEYRFYTEKIIQIEQAIEAYISEYFQDTCDLLMELPGVKKHSAAVILGEIGPNVEASQTAGHLTSWAGMSPGSNESGGKQKNGHTTQGNKY